MGPQRGEKRKREASRGKEKECRGGWGEGAREKRQERTSGEKRKGQREKKSNKMRGEERIFLN